MQDILARDEQMRKVIVLDHLFVVFLSALQFIILLHDVSLPVVLLDEYFCSGVDIGLNPTNSAYPPSF